MDKIIDNNLRNTQLDNDIRTNELRFSSSSKCPDDTQNDEDLSPIVIVNLRGGKKNRDIRAHNLVALIDGGATDSFVLQKYTQRYKHKWKKIDDVYDTAGGDFAPKYKVKLNFSLPEFSESKIITSDFRIDDINQHKQYGNIGYDMVIGRDILHPLGLSEDFATATIQWSDTSVPMKPPHFRTNAAVSNKELKEFLSQTAEPKVTQEATERVIKILDSNYEKADLLEVVANAHQLDNTQKQQLLELLLDFEDLFDGTLGHWQTEPVNIELKPDAKPYSGRYYPVPRVNKETFKKELLRLVDIGVL